MFEQYIADGASIFITIVAILAGFAAAMGFIDFKGSTSKEETKED
ncbi:MAG: hypothetical protein ACNS60_01480 [Candidatus Cyclobacteriaceae bacterium M2_1C_046]